MNASYWMLGIIVLFMVFAWVSLGVTSRRMSFARKDRMKRAKSHVQTSLFVSVIALGFTALTGFRAPNLMASVMCTVCIFGPLLAAVITLWPERRYLPKRTPGDDPRRSAICVVAIDNDITGAGDCFGNGFFVSEDLVVTALHVWKLIGRYGLHTLDGPFPFEAVWFDPENDLVLLRLSESVPPHEILTLANNSANLLPGVPIVCIGYGQPGGKDVHWQSQEGRVIWQGPASLIKERNAPPDDPRWREARRVIVTSGLAEPGRSGSPVLNKKGEVVGLAVGITTTAETVSVPVEAIRTLLAQASRQ